MVKPSGWKGHHVTRLIWKQKHNTKTPLQATQDSSGYGSGPQQPSGGVAQDEPIDLTKSISTEREPSPSNPSSTDAITSHASRKRKTDYEGKLLVESKSVELHPGCSRKDLIKGSRTPSDAVFGQNTPKPHTGIPWQRYSDGMAKKPYGGAHRPQNSLNQSRSTQRSPHQATYGKSSSLPLKPILEDNVTSNQKDRYEFPDDDHFAKKRKTQNSNPNTGSPGEPIELDDDDGHRPVHIASPLKSSHESLPRRNSQVSSTSKRNADSIGSQLMFRNVEARMKPNSKRMKPGQNAFYTPQTTDSGQVSPYFTQSDRQPFRQTRSSRSCENQVEEKVERQPEQQRQLHLVNIDEDDVIELPHVDAARKKELSETRQTERDTCKFNGLKSPIHVRTPATTADRIGISNNEDPDTSVDELHGPATMGNISPNGLPSNRRKVEGRPSERAERHEYDLLVSPKPPGRKSSSDIPITRFSSGDKQESKSRKVIAIKKRRNEAPSFVLKSLNLSHHCRLFGPSLVLIYDEDSKEFDIFSNGSPVPTEPKLSAHNVNNCLYSHPYVRLRGPKIDDRGLYFDLTFIDEEISKEFLQIVEGWSINFFKKSNDEMQKTFSRAGISDGTVADKREMDLLGKRVERGVDRQTNNQEERRPSDRSKTLPELLASMRSPGRQIRLAIPHPNQSDKPVESEFDFIPLEPEQVASELKTVRTRAAAKRLRLEHADEVVLEEKRYSVRHGLGEDWDQPVVYPRTGKKRTTVEQRDLVRLDEGEFLNDSLIEFYIRWLNDKFKVPEHQVYFFSTHFYTALTRTQKGQRGINYAAVERWTAKDDIFIHDFVIVPVNEATHWYLAIICNLPNVKRKFALEDKEDDANDRPMSSAARAGYDEPDVMEIDPTEAPPSPTHSLSIQYSNLKVGKQSHVKSQSKAQLSSSGPIYVFDEEEERSGLGTVKETPATPQMKPLSDMQNTQTSDIGVFADAKSSPSSARKAKRKSGPPPRKYDPTQPAVVILDSLNSAHAKTISNLKDYLIAEGSSKRGLELSRDDFRGINAKEGIPQQDNSCDCGLYLLGYIHKFIEDPKQFGHKLLLQEFDLHNDWPNMVPSTMRNGIRNELMRIHAEQKAEREEIRKAKKAVKRTGKAMAATQAAASSSLEKEVVGSTAPRDGILKPPSPQVVIDQSTTSTGQQNSPVQQPIEDKKSHSPQMGQTPVISPLIQNRSGSIQKKWTRRKQAISMMPCSSTSIP